MAKVTPKCTYCARRDGCMDYSDKDLQWGAEHGHVPLVEDECKYYRAGNEDSRAAANVAVVEFYDYAKELVKSHAQAPQVKDK